jgi:hypothetical protein
MAETGGVLLVHAHPDDESMASGGTIARLVAEGARVDLVTCTDGAEGEIHDPSLDPDEARPRLAQIRAAELACSVDALGGGAVHQHLLGYRDSGMMGTDANQHPDSFWQAEVEEATRRLGAEARWPEDSTLCELSLILSRIEAREPLSGRRALSWSWIEAGSAHECSILPSFPGLPRKGRASSARVLRREAFGATHRPESSARGKAEFLGTTGFPRSVRCQALGSDPATR